MILDEFRLDGKVAVVAGAVRGIGQAIARALCEVGAEVIMSDIDRLAVLAAARRLEGKGVKATPMTLDVTDSSAVEAAAIETDCLHGRVDILVSNAGIGSLGAAIDMGDDDWRRILDVNTSAVF